MKKGLMIITLVGLVLISGGCAYALSSLEDTHNNLIVNSVKQNKNLLKDDDFKIIYGGTSLDAANVCENKIENQNLVCNYQFFVFEINAFSMLIYSSATYRDYILFDNEYKIERVNYNYGMLQFRSFLKVDLMTNEDTDKAYLTYVYNKAYEDDENDKYYKKEINHSNIKELMFSYEPTVRDSIIKNYDVKAAVYQNNDGVELPVESLFNEN